MDKPLKMEPIEKDNQSLIIINIILLASMAGGLLLRWVYELDFLGGFGLGIMIMSFLGYLLFKLNKGKQYEQIETASLYFLLLPVISGVVIIIINSRLANDPYYNGIGTGICLYGFVIYAFEAMRRWTSLV